MGLGPLRLVNLEEARAANREVRAMVKAGVDSIEERRKKRDAAKLEAVKAMTFKQSAEAHITAHRAGWGSAKHAAQWETTLATYVYPIIGALPVQAIDTALVLKVLEQEVRGTPDTPPAPLWTARNETASRLRGRIESILDMPR